MRTNKPTRRNASTTDLLATLAGDELHALDGGGYEMREDEIVVDLFCGAGGSAEGIRQAIGESPMFSLNHNPVAIGVHDANHPETIHLLSDVFAMDPAAHVPADRGVGLLTASPSCVHFSTARGGKPMDREIRDQAWVVCNWAEHPVERYRPRVIVVENVREFLTWAPLNASNKLDRRFVDRDGLGSIFKEWRSRLVAAGYRVEFRVLNAADYGVATKRRRLLIVARRDAMPIRFPRPTHGPRDSEGVRDGTLTPYDTAARHIDFTIRAHPIFMYVADARRAGCIRPLAENTLRRVAAGVEKFVIEAAEPYIIPYYGAKTGEASRARPVSDPLPTQSTENRFALVNPVVSPITHTGAPRYYDMGSQLPTLTCARRGELALISPVCAATADAVVVPMRRACAPVPLGEPMPAFATRSQMALATGGFRIVGVGATGGEQRDDASAFIVGAGGGAYAGKPRTADDAINTITCHSRQAIVMPSLIRVNHGDVDRSGKRRGRANHDVLEPLPTQPTSNEFAVVAPRLATVGRAFAAATMVTTGYGERAGQAPRCLDVQEPIGTFVASGGKHAVVEAGLVRTDVAAACTIRTDMHSSNATCAFDATGPLNALTTSGGFGIVTAGLRAGFIVNNNTNRLATSATDPIPAMTTGNQQIVTEVGLVRAAHVGQENFDDAGADARGPFSTMTLSPHHSVVETGLAVHAGGRAAFMAQNNFGKVGHAVTEPMSTLLESGSHQSVVEGVLQASDGPRTAVFMAQHNAANVGHPVDEPVSTMTTAVCHQGVVTSHIMTLRQNADGSSVDEPLAAFCAAGNHHAEVRTCLVKYYGNSDGQDQSAVDAFGTFTTKDRFAVVQVPVESLGLTEEQRYEAWWIARFLEIYGTKPQGNPATAHLAGPRPSVVGRPGAILWTVEMRMLVPKEAFSASSFPSDYQFERMSDGTPTTKTQQMALVGNAVPPGLARAIVGANCKPRPSISGTPMRMAA